MVLAIYLLLQLRVNCYFFVVINVFKADAILIVMIL